MAPVPGDDGSVFSNSAQNWWRLYFKEGERIRKEVEHGSNFKSSVSRCPSESGDVRLESCLILWILNEDLKCSESRVALCVKHTLQKKVSYLQQVSLFNRVISGSNPGYYPGQCVIRISVTDPVSTLGQATLSLLPAILFTVLFNQFSPMIYLCSRPKNPNVGCRLVTNTCHHFLLFVIWLSTKLFSHFKDVLSPKSVRDIGSSDVWMYSPGSSTKWS